MKLADMKMPELKALAKEHSIERCDSMKKVELIEAIELALENQNASANKSNAYHDHMGEYRSKSEREAIKSSSEVIDIEKHPKFAKFKSHLGVKHHDK